MTIVLGVTPDKIKVCELVILENIEDFKIDNECSVEDICYFLAFGIISIELYIPIFLKFNIVIENLLMYSLKIIFHQKKYRLEKKMQFCRGHFFGTNEYAPLQIDTFTSNAIFT